MNTSDPSTSGVLPMAALAFLVYLVSACLAASPTQAAVGDLKEVDRVLRQFIHLRSECSASESSAAPEEDETPDSAIPSGSIESARQQYWQCPADLKPVMEWSRAPDPAAKGWDGNCTVSSGVGCCKQFTPSMELDLVFLTPGDDIQYIMIL